jgi:hypothetical protein
MDVMQKTKAANSTILFFIFKLIAVKVVKEKKQPNILEQL